MSNDKQIFVKEFRWLSLQDVLRQIADWSEEKERNIWNIVIESDEDQSLWIGFVYYYPSKDYENEQ